MITNPSLKVINGDNFFVLAGDKLIQDSIKFTQQLCNGLEPSADKITLQVLPNEDMIDILQASSDLTYEFIDGEFDSDGDPETTATYISVGRLNPKVSWGVSNKGEEPWTLNLEGNLYKLDIEFTDEDDLYIQGTLKECVASLVSKADLEIGTDIPTDSSGRLYGRSFDAGTSVRDLLNDICEESGYVYYFETTGEISFVKLDLSSNPEEELDGSILSNIKLSKNVNQYENLEVTFDKYSTIEYYEFYRWIPEEAQMVSINDWLFPEGTKVSIDKGFDGKEVVAILDDIEWRTDPVSAKPYLVAGQISNKSFNINIHNTTGAAIPMRLIVGTGKCVVKESTVKNKSGVKSTSYTNKSTLKVESKWIRNEASYDEYKKILSNYYKYSNIDYTFKSTEDLELGKVYTVHDDIRSGYTQNVLIYKKSWTDNTELNEYTYGAFSVGTITVLPVTITEIEGYNNTGSQGPKGEPGESGTGIQSIVYTYGVSSNQSIEPISWTSTQPTLTPNNKFLWQKEVITYTDGNTDTRKSITGVYGDTGESGGNYLFEVTGTSEFQYDATKTGNQTLEYHVRVEGYDTTGTNWLTVDISETSVSYSLAQEGGHYKVVLAIPYKASYEAFTATFRLNSATSEQPEPQDVIFNLKSIDVTPYMFEAEGATTFKVDKRSRDSQIITYNVKVNGYTPSDTGWITMSTVPSNIVHTLDIEDDVVTGQIIVPLLNSFNDVSVTFHLNKTLTREPQPQDVTLYLKPVDITEYDRYMGTMDYVNPRGSVPIDNYVTGDNIQIPNVSVLDWAEVDRIDGVSEKEESTITSSTINGVQSSNGVSHSIVFPTVVLRNVNGLRDSYIPSTKDTLRRVGYVYLETLTWEEAETGVWESSDLSDIKYLDDETVVGNYLSENYELSSISEQEDGEIAVGDDFIRVKSTSSPKGEFIYELDEEKYVGSAIMSGDWTETQIGGTVIDSTPFTFYYNNGVSNNVTSSVELIYPTNGKWDNITGVQSAIWKYESAEGIVYFRKSTTVYALIENPTIEGGWSNIQYTYGNVDPSGLTFKVDIEGVTTDVSNNVVLTQPQSGKWSGVEGTQTAQWTYTYQGITVTFTKTADVQDSLKNPVIEGSWEHSQWTNTAVDITGLTFKVTLNGVTTDVTDDIVIVSPPQGIWTTSTGTQMAQWSYTYGEDTVYFYKIVSVSKAVRNPVVSGDWSNTQYTRTAVDSTGLTFKVTLKGVVTDVTSDVAVLIPTLGVWSNVEGEQMAVWTYTYGTEEVKFTKTANVQKALGNEYLNISGSLIAFNTDTDPDWLPGSTPGFETITKVDWKVATNIKDSYFWGWPSLETAIFDKVTNIEYGYDGAFGECPNLKTVVLRAVAVCYLSRDARYYFIGSPYFQSGGNGQIIVPSNLVSSYKSNPYWSSVSNFIVGGAESYDSSSNLMMVNRARMMAPLRRANDEPSTDSFLKIADGCTVRTLPVGSNGIISLHYLTEEIL